jgi:hypothetical protein
MPYYPPASGGGVATQDEGAPLGSTAALNFVGAGVTASGVNPTIVSIPGGGAGSVAQVAYVITGVPYNTQYAEAVVADPNIGATSKIIIGWGNITDADENTPDFDDIEFTAVPVVGAMTIRLTARDQSHRLGGSYKINYLIG